MCVSCISLAKSLEFVTGSSAGGSLSSLLNLHTKRDVFKREGGKSEHSLSTLGAGLVQNLGATVDTNPERGARISRSVFFRDPVCAVEGGVMFVRQVSLKR